MFYLAYIVLAIFAPNVQFQTGCPSLRMVEAGAATCEDTAAGPRPDILQQLYYGSSAYRITYSLAGSHISYSIQGHLNRTGLLHPIAYGLTYILQPI